MGQYLLVLGALIATAEPEAWPGREWARVGPSAVGLDRARLERARDYALTGDGAGMIVRSGRLVLSWGDLERRYDLKSSTKGIGVTALGLAVLDGKVALDDLAARHHPSIGRPPDQNAATGWPERITLRHLATQTAGFEKPGGYGRLLFEPGTRWHYSDAGPNWLAECLTLAYQRDLKELLFERVFGPIGIEPSDLTWRRNAYRPHEIAGVARREMGSGISANVDAMARIGLLYLRGGRWGGQRLLPRDFVERVLRPDPGLAGAVTFDAAAEAGPDAAAHYGLLWWNNADGTIAELPRDAAWTWGLYDSLIVVVPSLDLVVARAGASWPRAAGAAHYAVLRPFLGTIAGAVTRAAAAPGAPYPPSTTFLGTSWAPESTILRAAKGSDNWPLTWGDDDALYTAYGDGRGFEPTLAPRKLSLGLAKVLGPSDHFQGVNLHAPTLEQLGEGAKGLKASGLLMVDGVLYLWARNAGNARLAWSRDRGATWDWADWRFTASFGCPTFVQFGKNNAQARDVYVYVISPDTDSAYKRADRMVLARVDKARVADQSAYECITGFDAAGRPRWSADLGARSAVFENPGRCGRASMSYHPATRRYLLVVIETGDEPRFRGGFGIYDAPEPWGPWTTVFQTDEWDVGPGESASLPTKWMAQDGRAAALVFSGEDAFSVRGARFQLRDP